MKYKFVYDTYFIAKETLCLSEEEVRIVLATVLEHHNAIFWGYKPERLARAVSYLSNGNILMLHDIGMDEQQRLMNNFNNDEQYVLVESTPPCSDIIYGLLKKFSVVYKCVETDTSNIVNKTSLAHRIKQCNLTRKDWGSTGYVQGRLPIPRHYWFTTPCWDLYIKDDCNSHKTIKFAAVARSLSDVDEICVADTRHFRQAKKYYNTGLDEE